MRFSYGTSYIPPNLSCTPLPLQTVLVIDSAQGIIDNGGFQYFFEADFPGMPDYSTFIDAYERIGAISCANAIREALALFDFPQPHLHLKQRLRYLNKWQRMKSSPLEPLDKVVIGNKVVWKLLEKYAKAHGDAFGLP
jgi:hypothetical protein